MILFSSIFSLRFEKYAGSIKDKKVEIRGYKGID
jgi:hypothetical protein